MKHCGFFALAICALFLLCGCETADGKVLDLSAVYAVCMVLALLLFVGVCFAVQKKRFWVLLLFFCVFTVNAGYLLLSLSETLSLALWANRLAYLGSVFLPLCMLMIILSVMGTSPRTHTVSTLIAVSLLVFLLAASYPLSTLYYRSAELRVQGANTVLVKEYGPLHLVYLLYLIGYFSTIIVFIARAFRKKSPVSISHAVLLAIAVFVNLFVWLCEQFVRFEFEMLSVSYIISELFFIGVLFSASENSRLRNAAHLSQPALSATEIPPATEKVDATKIDLFLSGLQTLTETERAVCRAHFSRLTTSEILEKLSITENTLKYHNKNIYSKLCVSSKKELLELYKAARIQNNTPTNDQ